MIFCRFSTVKARKKKDVTAEDFDPKTKTRHDSLERDKPHPPPTSKPLPPPQTEARATGLEVQEGGAKEAGPRESSLRKKPKGPAPPPPSARQLNKAHTIARMKNIPKQDKVAEEPHISGVNEVLSHAPKTTDDVTVTHAAKLTVKTRSVSEVLPPLGGQSPIAGKGSRGRPSRKAPTRPPPSVPGKTTPPSEPAPTEDKRSEVGKVTAKEVTSESKSLEVAKVTVEEKRSEVSKATPTPEDKQDREISEPDGIPDIKIQATPPSTPPRQPISKEGSPHTPQKPPPSPARDDTSPSKANGPSKANDSPKADPHHPSNSNNSSPSSDAATTVCKDTEDGGKVLIVKPSPGSTRKLQGGPIIFKLPPPPPQPPADSTDKQPPRLVPPETGATSPPEGEGGKEREGRKAGKMKKTREKAKTSLKAKKPPKVKPRRNLKEELESVAITSELAMSEESRASQPGPDTPVSPVSDSTSAVSDSTSAGFSSNRVSAVSETTSRVSAMLSESFSEMGSVSPVSPGAGLNSTTVSNEFTNLDDLLSNNSSEDIVTTDFSLVENLEPPHRYGTRESSEEKLSHTGTGMRLDSAGMSNNSMSDDSSSDGGANEGGGFHIPSEEEGERDSGYAVTRPSPKHAPIPKTRRAPPTRASDHGSPSRRRPVPPPPSTHATMEVANSVALLLNSNSNNNNNDNNSVGVSTATEAAPPHQDGSPRQRHVEASYDVTPVLSKRGVAAPPTDSGPSQESTTDSDDSDSDDESGSTISENQVAGDEDDTGEIVLIGITHLRNDDISLVSDSGDVSGQVEEGWSQGVESRDDENPLASKEGGYRMGDVTLNELDGVVSDLRDLVESSSTSDQDSAHSTPPSSDSIQPPPPPLPDTPPQPLSDTPLQPLPDMPSQPLSVTISDVPPPQPFPDALPSPLPDTPTLPLPDTPTLPLPDMPPLPLPDTQAPADAFSPPPPPLPTSDLPPSPPLSPLSSPPPSPSPSPPPSPPPPDPSSLSPPPSPPPVPPPPLLDSSFKRVKDKFGRATHPPPPPNTKPKGLFKRKHSLTSSESADSAKEELFEKMRERQAMLKASAADAHSSASSSSSTHETDEDSRLRERANSGTRHEQQSGSGTKSEQQPSSGESVQMQLQFLQQQVIQQQMLQLQQQFQQLLAMNPGMSLPRGMMTGMGMGQVGSGMGVPGMGIPAGGTGMGVPGMGMGMNPGAMGMPQMGVSPDTVNMAGVGVAQPMQFGNMPTQQMPHLQQQQLMGGIPQAQQVMSSQGMMLQQQPMGMMAPQLGMVPQMGVAPQMGVVPQVGGMVPQVGTNQSVSPSFTGNSGQPTTSQDSLSGQLTTFQGSLSGQTHSSQNSSSSGSQPPPLNGRRQSQCVVQRSEVMGDMETKFDQLMDDIRDTNPQDILKRVSQE